MSLFGKIVLGNMAGMLLVMAGGGMLMGGESIGIDLVLIVLQAGINLLMGIGLVFSKSSRTTGFAFLLSGLLVAAIGPGVCSRKADWFRPEPPALPKQPS